MANLPTSIKNLNTLLGEQLTEGGGGGSSDFSTAEVTLIGENINATMPICDDYSDIPSAPVPGAIVSVLQTLAPGTYSIALFKGYATIWVQTDYTHTISGNISDLGGGMYLVSGDCTITIS